jgi:hypothetical protein
VKNLKNLIKEYPEEEYLLELFEKTENGKTEVLNKLKGSLDNINRTGILSYETIEKEMFSGVLDFRNNKSDYEGEERIRMEYLDNFFSKYKYISITGRGKGYGQAGDKMSEIIKEIREMNLATVDQMEKVVKLEILTGIKSDITKERFEMVNNIDNYTEEEFDQAIEIGKLLKNIKVKTVVEIEKADELVEKELEKLYLRPKKFHNYKEKMVNKYRKM